MLVSLAGFGQAITTPRYTNSLPFHNRFSQCGFVAMDDTYAGLTYGSLNQVAGICFHSYSAVKFGTRIKVSTDLVWRVPRQGSAYFNLEMTKYDIAEIGGITLSSVAAYKRIASHGDAINQLYVALGLWSLGRGRGLTAGYARQSQQQSDNRSIQSNGIMMQLRDEYFNQLVVKLSATYWFDQFQYSVAVREILFSSRFSLGMGYEKINTWNELDISLLYNL